MRGMNGRNNGKWKEEKKGPNLAELLRVPHCDLPKNIGCQGKASKIIHALECRHGCLYLSPSPLTLTPAQDTHILKVLS